VAKRVECSRYLVTVDAEEIGSRTDKWCEMRLEFSKESRIVAQLPEMGLGDNCNDVLLFGPDGRIWGLTVKCVFAAERDLSRFEVLAEYPDYSELHCYRFGMRYGPDGNIYFPNGCHLMRIRINK